MFRKRELLYIGQTRNLNARIMQHRYFDIDEVRIIPCKVSMLEYYERRLIAYFKPRCNKQHNPIYSKSIVYDEARLPIRKRKYGSFKYTLSYEGKKKIFIKAV
ncbi:MAG: GIY-YIG catalytic domain protein [Firmicutes bacterium ADurb.Bin193]|nr:MAG: GIY-YIG catalytic domain protein [Firmicutes bacterium ADurb.Bin193]